MWHESPCPIRASSMNQSIFNHHTNALQQPAPPSRRACPAWQCLFAAKQTSIALQPAIRPVIRPRRGSQWSSDGSGWSGWPMMEQAPETSSGAQRCPAMPRDARAEDHLGVHNTKTTKRMRHHVMPPPGTRADNGRGGHCRGLVTPTGRRNGQIGQIGRRR